ncbi:hypothetical protein SDC9_168931 [bioreactor metagenome]|uniref:Uncharacterized protein n=1 Tax=bioreactor metagenome TaxID=1076179 RepID=A0A645G3V5_9ZZZZ
MRPQKADFFGGTAGLHKLFVSFAWKADDDVGGDRWIGEQLPDSFDSRHKIAGRIVPVHAPQRSIAARLERNVKMGAKRGNLRQRIPIGFT